MDINKNVYLSADGIKEEPDPVYIHDEISKGVKRIENVIREESAKISEILRQALIDKGAAGYAYPLGGGMLYMNGFPESCKSCNNHPINGGSGICHCTLGTPIIK